MLGDPPHYFWSCQDFKSNNLTTTLLGRPTHHTTISDKCSDPCIVEHNPRIHDPDDVFPKRLVKSTHAGERELKKKKIFDGMKKTNFCF